MTKISEKQMKAVSGAVVGSSVVANILVYAGVITPRTPGAWIIAGVLMFLLAILAYCAFTSRSDS